MENEKFIELFKELAKIDVNDKTEKKNNLVYLSWTYAVTEISKRYNFDYTIEKFGENQLPYVYDENTGYMVFTNVTIAGTTKEMWLPVMDSNNKAMKKAPYTYKVQHKEWDDTKRKYVWNGEYDEKEVEACTMFDVNKTIMRCLVKNLAMFGLGLYIYAGEDLPFEFAEPVTDEQIAKMKNLDVKFDGVLSRYKIDDIHQLTYAQAQYIITTKENYINKQKEAKAKTKADAEQPKIE